METYKNDYKKEDDECLWEIHEIRRQLHQEISNKTCEEINEKAKEIFEDWKKGIVIQG